jgi:hypothetical protein
MNVISGSGCVRVSANAFLVWRKVTLEEGIMEDSPDSMFLPVEELRARTRRRVHIAIFMMFSPVALLFLIFIFQAVIPEWASLSIFAFFVVGVLSGLIYFMYYALGNKLFYHSLDLFKEISPDEIVLTNRYAVAKKGLVHLVATWGSNALFFIVFLHSVPAERLKLKIPRVIWRWEYKVAIGEIKVARRQGQYTVPISEEDFVTGECILYSLLIESMPPFQKMQYYSRDQLLQITSKLADEATRLGSGTIR